MSITVYVALLNEGTDAYVPVEAEPVRADLYRIVGSRPDDESPQFGVGALVRCRLKNLSGDFAKGADVMVAYEAAN